MERGAAGQLNAKEHVADHREDVEFLRERVWLLSGSDGAIARMHLEHGATYRQIAKVAGVNEVTVARRIRRIVKRLDNWKYVCLAREKGMDKFERAVAREYLVRGLGKHEIALRLRCGKERVAKALSRVEAVTGCSIRRKANIKMQKAKMEEKDKDRSRRLRPL
jgi:transposase